MNHQILSKAISSAAFHLHKQLRFLCKIITHMQNIFWNPEILWSIHTCFTAPLHSSLSTGSFKNAVRKNKKYFFEFVELFRAEGNTSHCTLKSVGWYGKADFMYSWTHLALEQLEKAHHSSFFLLFLTCLPPILSFCIKN